MAIRFFEEETDFRLSQKNTYKRWLKKIASIEGYGVRDLNYIFCSDEYLHDINLQYLNHNTYTDIITFDQREQPTEISGEIYISIERVKENAVAYSGSFEDEIKRVISHGLLHLCGYSDKDESEKKQMRLKEEEAMSLFESSK